jgi:hypothetical protein
VNDAQRVRVRSVPVNALTHTAAALLSLQASVGCHTPTVDEAETKGDIAFLEQAGTSEAMAAIGRLADRDPKAQSVLQAHSFDPRVFQAAWSGVLRDAGWAAPMFRQALADPKEADLAASELERHDVHLAAFTADLEGALERVAASRQNGNVIEALVSIGPPAHGAVLRRLADPATRSAMCRGMASKEADADTRRALLEAPATSRDDEACVDAVVSQAAGDGATLAWLAERGETGLLGAAGKDKRLACPTLRDAWTKAFAARARDEYGALSVPLGYATKRCAAEMDGLLADVLLHRPAARSVVVKGIDPFGFYRDSLARTCAALRSIGPINDTQVVRDRATDALYHACTQ